MTVLGIETATTVCGAAVAHEGVLLSEAFIDERNIHAEKIMGLVDEVLRSTQGLNGIDAIAVSIGPGSFTGLRIGVSVAKGLAYAAGKKVVAVPTLEALATRAWDAGVLQAGAQILALLQARRHEAYTQRFAAHENGIVPVDTVRVVPVARVLDEVATDGVAVTGDIHLLGASGGGRRMFRPVDPAIARCSAASVALLGERLLVKGQAVAPASLEPEYKLEFFLNAPTT